MTAPASVQRVGTPVEAELVATESVATSPINIRAATVSYAKRHLWLVAIARLCYRDRQHTTGLHHSLCLSFDRGYNWWFCQSVSQIYQQIEEKL